MNCCSECFSSSYLKDIINRNKRIGNCDFCNSIEVSIYSIDEKLKLIFQNILDLYSINAESENSIETQIEIDFKDKIFSNKPTDTKILLKEIVKDDYDSYRTLFENNVVLNFTKAPEKFEAIKPLQISWEKFANEIKTTNRFHIQNTLDLDKLQELLNRYKKPINKGRKFYRARISNQEGFEKSDMFNPPVDKAKAGRANPTGISYLYLADHIKTTLYEARASLFDYVSANKRSGSHPILIYKHVFQTHALIVNTHTKCSCNPWLLL